MQATLQLQGLQFALSASMVRHATCASVRLN